MNPVWLLIGLLSGAALAALLLHLRAREQTAERQLSQRSVEGLMAPVRDGLERVDQHLQRLDRERRETRGRLEAQLASLTRTGEQLRSETGSLASALRQPHARGQWGQMQLRRVVELAGMIPHCDFSEQVTLTGPDGQLRPDLVVRLPGGAQVVVDAKAPLQAVLDAYRCDDEAERQRHLRAQARLLRTHVRALAGKSYWAGLPSAPAFVVLFLPAEHLYVAALEADPVLLEEAMSRRVLVATPTTLLAILDAVAYGWQQEQAAESAQAIAELGRELHRRLTRLSGLLATLGQRLNGTVRAFNDTVGSYEARVLPGAQRLSEQTGGRAGPPDSGPAQIDLAPRQPSVPGDHEGSWAA